MPQAKLSDIVQEEAPAEGGKAKLSDIVEESAVPEQSRSWLDTAKDVAVGAVKGLGNSITAGTAIAPLINKMAVKSFGSGAALPESNEADRYLSDTLTASNTPQMVGKGLEIAGELVGPTAIGRLMKLAEARAAVQAVAPKAVSTGTSMVPHKLPTPPTQVAVAPTQAAASGTSFPLKAALSTKAAPPTLPRTGTSFSPAPLPKIAAPVAKATEAAAPAVADTAESSISQFAKMMGDKGAKIDEVATKHAATGNLSGAADVLDQGVIQSVNELARDLRRGLGSSKGGAVLNPADPKAGAAAIKRLAPGPSRTPLAAETAMLDEGFKRGIMDPRGAGSTKLITGLGTTAAGAAIGGTQGDTDEEHIENAIMGGMAGALVVPTFASIAAVGVPKTLQSALVHGVLASPRPLLKAWSGAVGGVLAAAAENPQAAPRIISTFTREGPRVMREALKKGSPASIAMQQKMGTASDGLLTRIYGSMDAAARHAMEAGGISADDAARYTLSGKPTTETGTLMLAALSHSFTVRYATALFPRVGIQMVERTLERIPGIGMTKSLQTTGNPLLKQVYGAAAAAVGAANSDNIDPAYLPFIAAAAGPYGVLFAGGVGGKKAYDKTGDILEGAQAGANIFGEASPLPRFGTDEVFSIPGRIASVVPAAVRDIAQMRDPYDRDTEGQGPLARAKKKIPGLRETLPVAPGFTNLEGKPLDKDRATSPLKRLMTSPPFEGNKFKDIPEPVVAELKRLEVKINPPSNERKLTVGKHTFDVPPEAAAKRQEESRQFLIPLIEKAMARPEYQRADDVKKKRILDAVISRAEEAGSARARANVIKTLRERGSFKK